MYCVKKVYYLGVAKMCPWERGTNPGGVGGKVLWLCYRPLVYYPGENQ